MITFLLITAWFNPQVFFCPVNCMLNILLLSWKDNKGGNNFLHPVGTFLGSKSSKMAWGAGPRATSWWELKVKCPLVVVYQPRRRRHTALNISVCFLQRREEPERVQGSSSSGPRAPISFLSPRRKRNSNLLAPVPKSDNTNYHQPRLSV